MMDEIIYVNNLCRACLSHEGEFYSVFVPDETNGSVRYADMIMSCTSIQISAGDGLPEQICSTCASVAAHFYLFKQRCQESDELLRQQLFDKSQVKLFAEQDKIDDPLVCQKPFSGLRDFDQHIKSYHEKDSSDPDSVPEEEQLLVIKSEEILVPVQKAILKCEECGKSFRKLAHLKRHLKTHAPVKSHYCDKCKKGFTRAEQYYNHMNGHSGIKPHVCDLCNKGFNQVSNLKDHMRTHNGEKPFLCSICGKGFNQLGNLRQHTVRHSGVKSHICSTCGNGFASKGELCAHLRKHTGARPFICATCNRGFTTSSSLTKHKRIHSGEKPYECEVCKMKFSRSGILARHKRTHTGEKPYVCRFCSKAFSQSNDLSSHLRIHTGEKPFICDVCGQAFRQSSALKTHKKTHLDRSLSGEGNRKSSSFMKEEFGGQYGELKLAQVDFIAKF